MGKGTVISIVVLGLVIIVAFIFWSFYKDAFYYNSAIKNSSPQTCLKIGEEPKIANCLGEVALSKNDFSVCAESPKMYIMTCFDTIAEKSNNIIGCQSVNPPVDEYNCYTAFANTKKQSSTCFSLSGEKKGYCYQAVAIANKDISICDQDQDRDFNRSACKEAVNYWINK